MKSVNKLIQEHDNILVLTQVMEKACGELLSGGAANPEEWLDMVAFGQIYADQLHHQKEENILFAEMVSTLGTTAQKLIQNGMLVEHDLGRLYLKQLKDAVELLKIDPDNKAAKLNIIGNAVAYRDLLKRHIDKENDVVFNFGKNNLSPESIQKVEELSALEEAKEATKASEKEQLLKLANLSNRYL